jgi:hypothetical protein
VAQIERVVEEGKRQFGDILEVEIVEVLVEQHAMLLVVHKVHKRGPRSLALKHEPQLC